MGAFGERVQCADQEPILVRHALTFRADELVDGFDDDVRGLIRCIVPDDRGTVRGDRLGLGNRIQRSAFGDQQIDAHERLKSGAEARFGAAHALGYRPDLAMVARQDGDDAIGLRQLGRA